MRIETLREFIELSEDADFGASAKRLNLSESALSNHIKALESELGFKLVERWPSRRLTPSGNLFLKYARRITGLYNESLRVCSQPYADAAGKSVRVAVSALSPKASAELRSLIEGYRAIRPDVSISCCGERSSVDGLLVGRFDVTIIANTSGDPTGEMLGMGVRCVPFFEEEVLLWVSRNSRLYHADALRISDLGGYNVLVSGGNLRECWERSVNLSLQSDNAVANITCLSADSDEEFFLLYFGDEDVLLASRSKMEGNSILVYRDDRALVPFRPAVFSTTYLGYRADAPDHVRDFVSYLAVGGK